MRFVVITKQDENSKEQEMIGYAGQPITCLEKKMEAELEERDEIIAALQDNIQKEPDRFAEILRKKENEFQALLADAFANGEKKADQDAKRQADQAAKKYDYLEEALVKKQQQRQIQLEKDLAAQKKVIQEAASVRLNLEAKIVQLQNYINQL